jgi:hypothetical protein
LYSITVFVVSKNLLIALLLDTVEILLFPIAIVALVSPSSLLNHEARASLMDEIFIGQNDILVTMRHLEIDPSQQPCPLTVIVSLSLHNTLKLNR